MFPRSSPSASPRFICPHCRSSLDPAVLDEAVCGATRYRICPECDGAVALTDGAEPATEAAEASEDDDLAVHAVVRRMVSPAETGA